MHKKQSGAVLIISLIILVALTLFVLSGSKTVSVQEKMTSAVRDLHISLEIAESGITDAEAVIDGFADVSAVNTAFTDAGDNGLYSQGHGPTDLFASANVTSAATTTVSGTVAQYFIEDLGEIAVSSTTSSIVVNGYGTTTSGTDIRLFKIVSRSMGRDGQTERLIVSYYGKNF